MSSYHIKVTGAALLTLVESERDRHRILQALLDFSPSTDVQKDVSSFIVPKRDLTG